MDVVPETRDGIDALLFCSHCRQIILCGASGNYDGAYAIGHWDGVPLNGQDFTKVEVDFAAEKRCIP